MILSQRRANSTQGSVNPTQQSTKSNQGSTNPTRGVTKTSQENVKPTQETAKTTQGNGIPVQRNAKPNQGGTKPGQRSANPNQGSTKPSQRSANPSQGSTKSTLGCANQSPLTVKPTQRRAKPSQAGTNSTYGCGSSTEKGEHIQGQLVRGEIETGPRGRQYAETVDGRHWTRRQGGEWTETRGLEAPPKEEGGGPDQLLLVMQEMDDNAPDHWSLFVGKRGRRGNIYQVKGKPLFTKAMDCIVEKEALYLCLHSGLNITDSSPTHRRF